MEYSKARRIRKTGLFKLIAEKKFEQGQGLGSSIGGAISDKFKARATGFKESLDPLNMTRKLFGKGILGDVAVTGLGRLFGRKEEDIGYFGGFKRKTKRDPNFSSISPGVIRPLKFGDSVADILGKMYNFMLKTDEKRIVNNEIEAAFRQEQIDEDERRHQELVKAIRKFTGKKGKGTGKEDSDSSLFDLLKYLPLLLALPKIPGLPKIPNIKSAPGKPNTKTPKPGQKIEPKPGEKAKPKGKAEKAPKGAEKKPRTYNRDNKGRFSKEPPTAKKAPKSKAWEIAKKSGSYLNNPNNLPLKAVGKMLAFLDKIPFLKSGMVLFDLREDLTDLYDTAVEEGLSSERVEDKFKRVLSKFAGGQLGIYLGTELGAAGGAALGGPWGAIIGGATGMYLGATSGEKIAEILYDYYAHDKLPFKGVNEIQYDEMGNALSSTPTETPVKPTPKSTPVPKKMSSTSAGGGESSVAVNNTVNNIGGKKPKSLQMSTANSRNKDLDRYLRTSSVVV